MIDVKRWILIPAAGVGSRMQSDIPKQYLQICGLGVQSVSRVKVFWAVRDAGTKRIDFGNFCDQRCFLRISRIAELFNMRTGGIFQKNTDTTCHC